MKPIKVIKPIKPIKYNPNLINSSIDDFSDPFDNYKQLEQLSFETPTLRGVMIENEENITNIKSEKIELYRENKDRDTKDRDTKDRDTKDRENKDREEIKNNNDNENTDDIEYEEIVIKSMKVKLIERKKPKNISYFFSNCLRFKKHIPDIEIKKDV